MKDIKVYGDIRLLDIEDSKPNCWDESGVTHIRVTLPADTQNIVDMHKKGFILADRTLGTAISLKKSKVDFDKLIRMEIVETKEYKEDILRIARDSFVDDRRFHIGVKTDSRVAELVLKEWIDKLESCLVCLYKDKAIGFVALKYIDEDTAFIHLAAVEEKYRATGAAVSLYAKAASLCRERGIRQLTGRVSSKNTAVINLYTFLGATVNSPLDVYLKEVIK